MARNVSKTKGQNNSDENKTGELLVANNEEISGWAISGQNTGQSQEDFLVTILINGTPATRVHANRQSYIKGDEDNGLACGFTLRVHESLLKTLPLKNKVEAQLPDGQILGFGPEYQCDLIGYEGVSSDELSKQLQSGRTLAAKSGMLIRTISERKGWGALKGWDVLALETYLEAEDVFRKIIGRDLFVAYGTLLGLVREGKLIGHDDDVDAMFMLHGETPEEAGREFLAITDALKQARQNIVSVYTSGNFHWEFPKNILLDVFGCWVGEGEITGYMFSFKGDRLDILPAKRQNLCGLDVLTPANPEKFLEGTYGKNWSIPDPHFQWQPSKMVLNKMDGFAQAIYQGQLGELS